MSRPFPFALLALAAALALAACGSDGPSGEAAPAPSASSPSVEPCELLTPEAVAGALGVPAAEVALDEEATARMDGGAMGHGCRYAIASEGYDAATLTLREYDSAEAAAGYFASAYRTKTEQELGEIEAAGDRAAEQLEADGQDLGGVDAGAMLSGLAGKFSFEPIAGAGDEASVEINRILDPAVATTAHVRQGARIYSVEVAPSRMALSDEDVARAREDHAAIARAVAGS